MDFWDKEIQETIFRFSVIILLGLLVWGVLKTPAYIYQTEYISDSEYDYVMAVYGDMGCIVDNARRATTGSYSNIEAGYEIIFRCPVNIQD